jgi:ubiquinone/menaquinone biosynthesis C-methylase UbiE
MKKLNLGCGKDIKQGWVNLDVVKLSGVDKVHDLDKFPYPFKKDEFDEVYCAHVLEHLSSITKPMEELWRIVRPGGRVIVRVPIYPGYGAFADPTHKSFFTYVTFNYFRPEDRLNYYSKARFKILKRRIGFPSYFKFMEPLVNISEKIQKAYYFLFSNIIPPHELYIELKCLK